MELPQVDKNFFAPRSVDLCLSSAKTGILGRYGKFYTGLMTMTSVCQEVKELFTLVSREFQ